MAEGGYDAEMEDPLLGNKDDDDDEQEVSTTGRFDLGGPGATATPYDEHLPVKTWLTEQSGLPDTSYAETSFGGETSRQRSWRDLSRFFPEANGLAVESDYNPQNGRLMVRIPRSNKW